jgi:hypothetical protein
MNQQDFFYLGLTFIMMHEMDAIRCKEWRIFPFLSYLNDELGFKVFIFTHIPLFFFIFYNLLNKGDNSRFIYGLNVFFIIHLVLHILFLKHKKNEFKDWISWTIIIGAGISGLICLI